MLHLRNTRTENRTPVSPGVLIFLITLLFFGCTDSGNTVKQPEKQVDPATQKLIKQGRAAYYSTCIACHNQNPSLAGSVGPELTGASVELLEAKILKGEYPQGYQAKRTTTLMVPLPHLGAQIPALHAFLNQ
jgi:mono/diheme cytochrome c family protein